MSKDTSIWNAYKKQPFFYRKIKKIDANEINIIKTPKTIMSKNDVPRDKDCHHYKKCRKERTPFFVKLKSGMKTK